MNLIRQAEWVTRQVANKPPISPYLFQMESKGSHQIYEQTQILFCCLIYGTYWNSVSRLNAVDISGELMFSVISVLSGLK